MLLDLFNAPLNKYKKYTYSPFSRGTNGFIRAYSDWRGQRHEGGAACDDQRRRMLEGGITYSNRRGRRHEGGGCLWQSERAEARGGSRLCRRHAEAEQPARGPHIGKKQVTGQTAC